MVLAMAAAGLLANRRSRVVIKDVVTRGRGALTQRAPTSAKVAQRPVLRGLTGHYANTAVPLDAEQIAIGRDASLCQLVLPADATDIGRRHCTVRWDKSSETFVLEDCWTSNGTFLDNGERIDSVKPRCLKPGERFYLASERYQFEVALEPKF